MTGKKNTKIGLALVGAGGIGKRYVRAFLNSKVFTVKAIVDVDTEKAKIFADQFDDCEVFANVRELIPRTDIQAAVVATPHLFLSSITQELLKAKKHVLCEKPGAIHSRDIQKAIALAKKNKLCYMIGFNHRFHPSFLLAKKFVEQDKIGKLQFIRARYAFGGRKGFETEWRHNKKMAGGGELIDQGVHMIDMSRLFLGDFNKVCGFTENLYWNTEVEDNAFVLLKNKTNNVASIHVSWSNWKPIHIFEIYGNKGSIVIEGLGRKYGGTEKVILGKRNPEKEDAPFEKEFVCDPDADKSLERELDEFARCIRTGEDPSPSGKDGLEALKIVEKVYKQNN